MGVTATYQILVDTALVSRPKNPFECAEAMLTKKSRRAISANFAGLTSTHSLPKQALKGRRGYDNLTTA